MSYSDKPTKYGLVKLADLCAKYNLKANSVCKRIKDKGALSVVKQYKKAYYVDENEFVDLFVPPEDYINIKEYAKLHNVKYTTVQMAINKFEKKIKKFGKWYIYKDEPCVITRRVNLEYLLNNGYITLSEYAENNNISYLELYKDVKKGHRYDGKYHTVGGVIYIKSDTECVTL